MLRDYGVCLVGLLRDIARKIDEFYAQGLWGTVCLVGLLRGRARKIEESSGQGVWGKFSEAIERCC